MIFVQTLGTSLIRAGSRRYTPSSARAFATLFYLSANGGRRVPRERLHSLIYPRQTEHNAAHSVRQLLYRLRGAGVDLDGDAESVSIPSEAVAADYTEIIAADRPTAEQIAKIRQGLLPGYDPAHSEEYAEWYEAHRAEISTKLQLRLLQELARSKRVGDWTAAERCARACMALDPLNYEANCGLAEAVAGAGSKSLALDLLDDFMKELGESPADLKRPAAILRKRISEKMPAVTYRSRLDLPFIGREQEMLQLSEAFQRARRGEAQCVVLSGEAGIGKTRIAAEFKTVAVLEGARVERVVAQPQDSHRPMGAFIDLVPLLLQLPGALGCSPASMAALRRLTKQTGSVDEAPSEATKNSEALFYSITCAISDLVDAIACETTLVVVVEDAHWLDAMSVRVLAHLVSERKDRRLMVIVSTREGSAFRKATPHSDNLLPISVNRLSPQATSLLVESALRDCDVSGDAEFAEWLCNTSAGHPLFASLLTLHYEQYRVRFEIPPTIIMLIEQRVSSISARSFDVLRTSAILGRYCTAERLVGVLELPTIELLERLRELESAGLTTNDTTIRITHPLIADVVVRACSSGGGSLLYARTAALLEDEAMLSRTTTQLWDCASLWVKAERSDRALAVLRRCARSALEIGRPLEAAETLSRALDLAVDREQRASIAVELIASADTAREGGLVLRGYNEACACGVTLTHGNEEIAAVKAIAHTGTSDEATTLKLVACAANPDATERHRLQAMTTLAMLVDDALAPLTPEAWTSLEECARVAAVHPDELSALSFLMIYHTVFGDISKVLNYADRLLRAAGGMNNPSIAGFQTNAGLALWRAGNSAQCLKAYQAGYESASRYGLRQLQVVSAASLASTFHELGQSAESGEWITRADAVAKAFSVEHEIYCTTSIDLALQKGALATARELYNQTMLHPPVHAATDKARWLFACGLRLRQLETDYQLEEDHFHQLSRFRVPHRDCGSAGDFEVEVAARALIRRGDDDGARELVQRFLLIERRARSPLRICLRNLIEANGWSTLVSPLAS